MDSTTAQRLIHENMPVLGSDHGQLAVVDHLEGDAAIKLTKDGSGQHHYIPLAWVTSVDDAVHVDRTGYEVMQAWATSPEALIAGGSGAMPVLRDDVPPGETLDDLPVLAAGHTVNSVDATVGQPLVERVQARKAELEAALAAIPETDIRARDPIELALSTVAGLLTGDLKHVPAVVASDLNLWLERHKHLAERAIDSAGAPAPLPDEAQLQAERAMATPPPRPLTDGTITGPWVGKPADKPTA